MANMEEVADAGLCRVNVAARYLNLSRSKIYQMMDSGEMAYIKFGASRRIERSELDRIVAACRIPVRK